MDDPPRRTTSIPKTGLVAVPKSSIPRPGVSTTVRAVVFDVGGVLIDWNPRYLFRKLFDGDEAAMEQFLTEICTPEWNLAQDAGRSFAEAVAERTARFPAFAPLIAAYDARWEEMVAGPFADTIALVEALHRRGVPLFSLTNFSTEKFALVRAQYPVFNLFDGIVVSGAVRLVKPSPEIFDHLIRAFDLEPAATLFIDDLPHNIAAAARAGFLTHLHTDAASLHTTLDRLALL